MAVAAPPRTTVPILLIGQAMASFDGSVATVAAPAVRAGLHASGAVVQLVVSGYLLSFAVFVVAGARLGDRFGHGRVFAVGLAGFTLASLACGLAPDAAALAVARIVQGAAAATALPQVLSIVQLAYNGPARDRAVAMYSSVLAVGVVAGQVAGGLLVSADVAGIGWRAVFLVNVPIGAALLRPAFRRLPATYAEKPAPLDGPSVIALSAATALLFAPLLFGRQQGWPPWVWPSAAGSCVLATAFIRRQRRARAHNGSPLLDFTVLAAPGVARRLAGACLVMGAYAGYLFALTIHLQSGLGFTAARAGLTFAPYAVGFGAASLSVARAPQSWQRLLPVVGATALAVGVGVVTVAAQPHWPTAAAVVLLALAGAGHAVTFGPLVARVTAPLRPDQASSGSALVTTGTLLAEALGIAVLGGVYLARAGHGAAASATAMIPVAAAVCGVAAVVVALTVARVRPRATRG